MKTITIKHIPAGIHATLKARARAHGRSLNKEIISVLASTVSVAPVNAAGLVDHARSVREGLGIYLTQAELKAFKNRGRR